MKDLIIIKYEIKTIIKINLSSSIFQGYSPPGMSWKKRKEKILHD